MFLGTREAPLPRVTLNLSKELLKVSVLGGAFTVRSQLEAQSPPPEAKEKPWMAKALGLPPTQDSG